MSKLDWGIGVATAITVGLFSYWSLNKLVEYRHRNYEQHNGVAAEEIEEPPGYVCGFSAAPFSISCSPIASNGTSTTDKATKYDLKAQQDMALAAFGMLFATAISLIIGGATIFFVIRALNETRETNRIASRLGEAQARAYLVVTNASIVTKSPAWTVVRIVVRNTGATPAREILVKFDITPFDIVGERRLSDAKTYDLGSGGDYEFEHTIRKPDGMFEEQKWRQSNDTMRADGTVCYSDIFGRRWENTFSFSCSAADFASRKPLKLQNAYEKEAG